MKILSITPFLRGAPINPFFGGKSKVSLQLTNALVGDGNEVFVLPWSKEKVWEQTNFRISDDSSYATAMPTLYIPRLTDLAKEIFFSFGDLEALTRPKSHIWNFVRNSFYDKKVFLSKAMEKVKPDVVHIHYSFSDAVDIYRDQNFSAPLLLTHHSNGVTDKVPLYDYVVFVSKFQYDQACKQFPEIKQKSCYIHNCISNNYFKPAKPVKSNKIIFLSRFKPQKGLQDLLNAFSVDKRLAKYDLSVIGEGDLEDDYKKFVKDRGLTNVHFLGRLSQDQNVDQMETASLFVVPSHGEGFALIYIEALCMGLPVIGYPPNIREHNEIFGMQVGYEFDAQNESPERLAELIYKAMNSELTAPDYRKRLMKKARSIFSYDTFKEKYLEMYKRQKKLNS